MPWLALLALISLPSSAELFPTAEPAPLSCVALDRFGCWFAPPTIRDENAPALLVFFRGWRNDSERSDIPSGQRVIAARQAFAQFELEKLAREQGVAVLITGAPRLAVEKRHLLELQG